MTIIEQTTLEGQLLEIVGDQEKASQIIELFNTHSDSDGILSPDEKKHLIKLEGGLRWKQTLMKRRDTKVELDKMQKYGENYVDHLKEDIDSLEWAITFIQRHSK